MHMHFTATVTSCRFYVFYSEYRSPTDASEDSVLIKDLKGDIVSLKPFRATLLPVFIQTLIFLIGHFFSVLKCSLSL